MRLTRIQVGLIIIALATIFTGMTFLGAHSETPHGAGGAQKQAIAPETLVPAKALLFAQYQGGARHREAFEKTAAYDALYKSGLMDSFGRALDGAEKLLRQQGVDLSSLKKALTTISEKGLTVAVVENGEAPIPSAVIVVHEGATTLQPELNKLVSAVPFLPPSTSLEIQGRKVRRISLPQIPNLEVCWWGEGTHLVIAAGVNIAEQVVNVASGKGANVTVHAGWKRQQELPKDVEVTSVFWLDGPAILKAYGSIPIDKKADPPVKLRDIASAWGLNTNGLMWEASGYRGCAYWSEGRSANTQLRDGLLASIDTHPLTIKDLPPLPANLSGFSAVNIEPERMIDALRARLKLWSQVDKNSPQFKSLEASINDMPKTLGFDPQKDLFNSLGNTVCTYFDSTQVPLALGFTIVVEVRDRKKLEQTLDIALEKLKKAVPGKVRRDATVKHGKTIYSLEVKGAAFSPSYAIDGKWLVVGLYPQAVEAFQLRMAGKLPRWTPSTEHLAGLKQLPEKFTSISVADPKLTYRLLTWATTAGVTALNGIKEVNSAGEERSFFNELFNSVVKVAQVPPAEVVTEPLFPNIEVTVIDGEGSRSYRRGSLPGIPLLDGNVSLSLLAGAAIAVLPGVQAARQAARMAHSKNNLKQMGLALYNYHDTFRGFPSGTIDSEKLKPEERLSFLAAILPFLDEAPLYNKLDQKSGWKSDRNRLFTSRQVVVYLNPGLSNPADGGAGKPVEFSPTHYVGIAGIGEAELTSTKISQKSGVFGYNRKIGIANIRDGSSNTMMMSEANGQIGPWAAGGKSTLRALTKMPYINGPDGIGGPWSNPGVHVLFADGSVRFISSKINPRTFEALSTIAGGEVPGEF